MKEKKALKLVKDKIASTDLNEFKSDIDVDKVILYFTVRNEDYSITIEKYISNFYIDFENVNKFKFLNDKKITLFNNFFFYLKLKKIFSRIEKWKLLEENMKELNDYLIKKGIK